MTVGRDTLLNLLRKLPEPDVGQLDVLGVDLSRPRDYPTGCWAVPWNGGGVRVRGRRRLGRSG
jgi:hypothetical protein